MGIESLFILNAHTSDRPRSTGNKSVGKRGGARSRLRSAGPSGKFKATQKWDIGSLSSSRGHLVGRPHKGEEHQGAVCALHAVFHVKTSMSREAGALLRVEGARLRPRA